MTSPILAAEECPGSEVTDKQSVGSFMSIIDGQPASPDAPQTQLMGWYNKNSGQFQSQFVGGMVFAKSGLFCQSQLTISAPTLIVDGNSITFQNAVTAAWEQRWFIDDGKYPTLSTQLSFQSPYNKPTAQQINILATFIAAKSFINSVAYLNVNIESPYGFNMNILNWNVITGYKYIIQDGLDVFADVFVQKYGVVGIEAAIEWDLTDGVSIGPGISVILSQPTNTGNPSSDVTVGISLSRGF